MPTRAAENSDTLIDVMITSKRIGFLYAGVFNPDISNDHMVHVITRVVCP